MRDKIEIMSAGVKIFDLLPGSSRPRGPPCGEPELIKQWFSFLVVQEFVPCYVGFVEREQGG